MLKLLLLLAPFASAAFAAPPILWYNHPAAKWEDALPLGNGRLGAMVFGGVQRERIQLNEDTIWNGPKRDRLNPNAAKYLPEVRRLLFEGKFLVPRAKCTAAAHSASTTTSTPGATPCLSITATAAPGPWAAPGWPCTFGSTTASDSIANSSAARHRALFTACAQASEILGVDADFRQRLAATARRLPELKIGKHGQLQEWSEDGNEIAPPQA